MADPARSWIEIYILPSARADLLANQVELACITRYPLPSKVIVEKENEFLAVFIEIITNN